MIFGISGTKRTVRNRNWGDRIIEVSVRRAGAPNENIVQNHLNIALLKVF